MKQKKEEDHKKRKEKTGRDKMSYKCDKCRKIIERNKVSFRHYLIPNGTEIVCSNCYNPELNRKFNEFQRKRTR